MKQIIETYKSNRDVVEHFITTSMNRLHLKKLDEKSSKRVFTASKCVKILYGVDVEYTLNTPYYHRNKMDSSKIGLTKSHYFERVSFNIDGTYLSNPYINASDGTAGITYAVKVTVAIDDSDSNEMLSKFLKSIIIALSIESLMVVFKIALNDHTELIHALFLIIGVSMMIYVLGKFNHMSNIKN